MAWYLSDPVRFDILNNHLSPVSHFGHQNMNGSQCHGIPFCTARPIVEHHFTSVYFQYAVTEYLRVNFLVTRYETDMNTQIFVQLCDKVRFLQTHRTRRDFL